MFLKRIFFIALFFISLVACTVQGDFGPINPTEEPVGTVNALPIPLDFVTLNEDPFAYTDRLIQVSGQYMEMQPLSCFPSKGPEILWGLEANGFQMNLTGFDQIVGLAPLGARITVDGVWQLYDGPLGCGKEPANGRVWHLEVSRIVFPNPLAFPEGGDGVSFTPIESNTETGGNDGNTTGGVDVAPQLPPPTESPNGYIDVVVPPTEVISDFDLTATAVGGSIQDGQTPTPSITPTPFDEEGTGNTSELTPTATITATSVTSVPTRSSGATTETPTPTQTPTPSEGNEGVTPAATESGGLGSEEGGEVEQTIIAPTITPTPEPYTGGGNDDDGDGSGYP